MAMKKGALGRGLQALLSENSTEDASATVTLRLRDVAPNPEQPRSRFDEQALDELTASVAQYGILQPLLVRPMADGSYQIVAGERRWRAARAAGLTEVPVVIRELSDGETAQLALIENLQREDLDPIEEAHGYRVLIDRYGLTQEEAASAVHKSRPAVANALRLLQLPDEVAQMVQSGELSAGHARALLAIKDPAAMGKVAREAVQNGWSVRQAEQAASGHKKKPGTGKKAAFSARFEDELALALSEQMGRRVKIAVGKKGGMLQVEYFDEDDLRALAKALAGEE